MADVFISYARSDSARAEQLARALQARNFDVWWDPELLPGEEYSKKIAGVLAEANAIIVMWSRASVASNWVLDEAMIGSQRSNLVPVLIEQVEPPLGFRQHQAEDLSGWPGPEGGPAFERVVQAVERLRGQPAGTGEKLRDAARARTVNRIAIGAAALAALGLGAVVVSQVVGGAGPADPTQPDDISTTDSPGAADSYGLAPAELTMFAPRDLIGVALERTTLEAIEAGAASGDPLGRTLLCLARAYGEGLDAPDPAGARQACEQAAGAGDGLALYQLSLFARAGEAGYGADASEADRLLAQAEGAGDPRAQTARARALLDRGEDSEAARLARAAVDQNCQEAAMLFGWMHEQGRGAPRDAARAFALYQRAAETGYAPGLRETARMLEDGVGVNTDYAQARERYALASDLGDGASSFRLARLHEEGRGGAPDRDAALRYYRVAAQQGVPEAQAEAERLAAQR